MNEWGGWCKSVCSFLQGLKYNNGSEHPPVMEMKINGKMLSGLLKVASHWTRFDQNSDW